MSAGPEVVGDQVAAQHQPLDPTDEVRFIRLLERRADELDRPVELTGVAARPGGVGQQLGARAGHRLRIRDQVPELEQPLAHRQCLGVRGRPTAHRTGRRREGALVLTRARPVQRDDVVG